MTLEYFLARLISVSGGSAELGGCVQTQCPFPSLGGPGVGQCPAWPKTLSRHSRGCQDGNVN